MTDCAELSAFVEKLHDLEATAAEKVAAEAHLQKCASCRSHFEFLERLSEESRAMTFPKPPESYWEHLPRKVLERLDSEERRPSGFFGFLFAPSSLRWAALGATLVLVAAVGISLLREDWKPEPAAAALAPRPAVLPPSTEPVRSAERPAALAPAAPAPQPEKRARSNAESEVAPSMARDEAAEFVSRPESDERVESALAAGAPAEPAVSVAASDEHHQAVAKESAAMRESANRYPSAAPAARLSRGVFEDCEAMRQKAGALGETPSGTDARYELALCSLQRHEREGTGELEALAVQDAEAFLVLEGEGTRAEEVREKLRRIRPN